MYATNSDGTVEISTIPIDTKNSAIVSSRDFLEASNDFCCFIYRTSSECWGVQGPSQSINNMCAWYDFPCNDILGMDDRSRFPQKWSLNMAMWAKSRNHLRSFIEEHGEFLAFFFIVHQEFRQSFVKRFFIADFHRPSNRVDSCAIISDSEMSLRTCISVRMLWRPEESGHVGSSYLEETGEYRERCPLRESCYWCREISRQDHLTYIAISDMFLGLYDFFTVELISDIWDKISE